MNRENGVLVVSGPAIPRVRIARDWRAGRNKDVPIGTRVAKELTISVDDAAVVLLPGRPGLIRRSHAVTVQCGEVTYEYVPDSYRRSRLVRDGRRVGRFRTRITGRAKAEWEPQADVRPLDVAIGYALAVAFGTGARPAWLDAIDSTADFVSPL
ncbi:hypothetical protein [Streptomyces sp. UNOB3_S3]|uniref:hypothetical protein n=1 Tax=Streptomyces sp. UNOB3_S3 TaxID=2871682 RepID=UPI001E5883DA|nr:hypothetical protein [Streptomyces sp. UNOB3_S3]